LIQSSTALGISHFGVKGAKLRDRENIYSTYIEVMYTEVILDLYYMQYYPDIVQLMEKHVHKNCIHHVCVYHVQWKEGYVLKK